jgi:hypothetical protein
MNEIRRRVPALALIGISALLGACGSSTPADSGSASNANTAHAQAVKFSRCMRSHGVGAFPDPSGSGGFTIDGVVNGSSLDPNAPAFTQAISACKSLEPAGFTGGKVTPEQAAARLKFAQCIRGNGVPDFPDPTPTSPLIDTNRIPSAAQPGGMSALHAAMQKCRDVAAAAGVTR